MAHCRISTEKLLEIQNDIIKSGTQQGTAVQEVVYFKGVNDAINALLHYIYENDMSKAKKGKTK